MKKKHPNVSAAAAGLLIVLFCILSARLVRAEDARPDPAPMTLTEFCRRVLEYYPRLKEQGATVELAIAHKMQAEAGYLPRIQGLAGATYGDDQVYVFGTLLRQRAFTEQDFEIDRLNNPDARANFNIGLHGEIPLFNAFQTISRVRQAGHMVASARHAEAFAKMEAILVASDAYLNTLAVEKVLEKSEEACGNSEADIRQAGELKEKGMVLGADYYAAKVIFGGLQNIRNNLRTQKVSMHALLNILMGEDPFRPVKLVDELHAGKVSGLDLKEWLSHAHSQRPDLLALEEAIRAREEQASGERKKAWPVISAFGDLMENSGNFHTGGGSFGVGLKGTIDLFAPDYSPRVKVAEKSLQKLKYEKIIATDSVIRDITGEYARFESLRANIPVLRDMAGDSDQAVNLLLPLYREGRKSIADLLDMRQGNIKTYQAYYAAMAGSRTALVRLMFLSGRLDESKTMAILGDGQ